MKNTILFVGPLLLTVLLSITVFKRPDRTDLSLVLKSAKGLKQGAPVFGTELEAEHNKSPLAVLTLIPLTNVSIWWLDRVWDVLVLGVYLGFAFLFARGLPAAGRVGLPLLLVLGLLFTLNSWNSELRLGQFNVLCILTLFLLVALGQSAVTGMWLALAILFKPVSIFFLPWVLKHSKDRKQVGWGALATVVILSLGYLWLFGLNDFVEDHISWVTFLPQAVEKHIFRIDNYGIPSALVAKGLPVYFSFGFPVLGLLLSGYLAWALPDARRSFAAIVIPVVIFSPTAWYQNYSLLIPYALLLWNETLLSRSDKSRAFLAGSLGCLYFGTQIFNPTLNMIFPKLFPYRFPLWMLVLSLSLFGGYYLYVSLQRSTFQPTAANAA